MRKSKTSKILVIQRTFIARPQLHFSGRNSDKQKVLASQQNISNRIQVWTGKGRFSSLLSNGKKLYHKVLLDSEFLKAMSRTSLSNAQYRFSVVDCIIMYCKK